MALMSSAGALEIALLLFVFFVLYTVVGYNLFEVNGSIYTAAQTGCEACSGLDDSVFTSFSSWSDTMVALFVLITTENFPDVSVHLVMCFSLL